MAPDHKSDNRKLIKFIIAFSLLFIAANQMGIREKIFRRIPWFPISVISSDINNDDWYDIITGHLPDNAHSDTGIVVLKNSGNGIFDSLYTTFNFDGYQWDLLSVDIDKNNYPEIIALKYTDKLRVYYNDNGNFEQYADFPLNISNPISSKTYGDVDGDNDVDILILSNSGFKWGIMKNDGSGQLSAPQYYSLPYAPADIKCAELTGDSMNDIVVSSWQNCTLYENNGNGFQSHIIDSTGGNLLEIADLDNDGDKDILSNDTYFFTIATILENKSNISYEEHLAFQHDASMFDMVLGDVNNDSLPDLIGTTEGGVYVAHNEGNFTFKLPDYYPFPVYGYYSGYSYCKDFNNDSWNDIVSVVHCGSNSVLMILYNDHSGHFIFDPPTNYPNNTFIDDLIVSVFSNPFRDNISISINAHNDTPLYVCIYNVYGKPIRVLENISALTGIHQYEWHGENFQGTDCGKGIFYVLINNGKTSKTLKILRL